jgi:SAM-dependent methyltransferase
MSAAAGYVALHRQRMGPHLYPTEFVVRTMLGRYPRLQMDRDYAGKRLLDLGFGDGRNMPLFRNLGVEICGVEPEAELCAMVSARMAREGIPSTLRVGHNAAIPFEDRAFDFVVACHSLYYVREGDRFADNLREVARVLRPGGWLVLSLPAIGNFILEGAEAIDGGHWRIAADPYGLRNGTIFRAFGSEDEIIRSFAPWFDTFSIGSGADDWYGIVLKAFYVVCRRKADEES